MTITERRSVLRARNRFRVLCESVPIPSPWNLDAYVATVAAYRGRPIVVLGLPTSQISGGCGTGSGLWIARGDDDLIVHDRDATPVHAQHIVLHEIGHMLLGHDGTGGAEAGEMPLTGLLPSIDPDTIRHVLCRTDYGAEIEQEAEAFADEAMLAAAGRAPRHSMRESFFGDATR